MYYTFENPLHINDRVWFCGASCRSLCQQQHFRQSKRQQMHAAEHQNWMPSTAFCGTAIPIAAEVRVEMLSMHGIACRSVIAPYISGTTKSAHAAAQEQSCAARWHDMLHTSSSAGCQLM
jgi:hypothetical protein